MRKAVLTPPHSNLGMALGTYWRAGPHPNHFVKWPFSSVSSVNSFSVFTRIITNIFLKRLSRDIKMKGWAWIIGVILKWEESLSGFRWYLLLSTISEHWVIWSLAKPGSKVCKRVVSLHVSESSVPQITLHRNHLKHLLKSYLAFAR